MRFLFKIFYSARTTTFLNLSTFFAPMAQEKTGEEKSSIEQEHDDSPSNVPDKEQGITEEKHGEEE